MIALPDERQQRIKTRLNQQGRVLAADLAREFNTSEDTIRRDLRDLAAQGLCRRVYGGALPVSPASGTLGERQAVEPGRKLQLGRAAAALVEAGQIVLIDAGSTNLCIAESLPSDRSMAVITNAPAVAAALTGRRNCDLIVIGGRIDPAVGGSIGARALSELGGLRADVYFLGACAISAATGVSAFDAEEAVFKRRLMEASERIIVTVTNDKLGTVAPFGVAALEAIDDLVIEADAPQARLDGLVEPQPPASEGRPADGRRGKPLRLHWAVARRGDAQ